MGNATKITQTLALATLVWAGSAAAAQKFEVRDPRSGENLYQGEDDNQEGARVTRYFDKNHKETLKETLATADGKLKSYQSANALTGEAASVNASSSGGYDISYAPGKTEKPKVLHVKGEKETFVAGNAPELIVKNWNTLMSGKPLKFDLILPNRLEVVPFQLVHRETRKVGEESREVFTLFPQNMLVKTLAPNFEFQYAASKALRQVNFPSALPVKGAKDKLVEAVY